MKPEPISDGVYQIDNRYYTINLVPGESVYGEDRKKIEKFEYRNWDPHRSKLGALLVKEKGLPFKYNMDILYLGAGDGTTISHLSDILTEGRIYAVEKARKPYRNLLNLSRKRKNIFPIMADASKMTKYKDIVGQVDLVYQDIAQRNQVEIFMKNLQFLKPDNYGMIAVKSRSIDVTKSPKKVFQEVENELTNNNYEVLEKVDISRWQKDHTIIVIRKPND